VKIASPLESHILFTIGPVPISQPVVTTWGIMAVLTIGCWFLTRRLGLRPTRTQAALELVVDVIARQIRETMDAEPRPYLPLIGTLFIFLLVANWSSLLPGVEPPTAALETDAALALIVFGATLWFGVRALGARGYLRSFAQPSIVYPQLLPDGAPVRQCHERRVHDRRRAEPCRVARTDPADGARDADRSRPGLHLRRARNGLYRQRHQRSEPIPESAEPRGLFMNWIHIVSILGAAFAIAIGAIAPALAQGKAVAAAMDAIARQPEAANTVSRTLFVGLAMIETMAIYCLVIALLLLFANPFA
jgi:F0F1-type ATP synthase membrane subunit c/vacuolar-type H+-ATPase subunit K